MLTILAGHCCDLLVRQKRWSHYSACHVWWPQVTCDIKPTKSLHAQCGGELIISHFYQAQIDGVYTRISGNKGVNYWIKEHVSAVVCILFTMPQNMSAAFAPFVYLGQAGCITIVPVFVYMPVYIEYTSCCVRVFCEKHLFLAIILEDIPIIGANKLVELFIVIVLLLLCRDLPCGILTVCHQQYGIFLCTVYQRTLQPGVID